MKLEGIIAAANDTLDLAERYGMREAKPAAPRLGFDHLVSMYERMSEPGFSIGKANRWLGYMQGVVAAWCQDGIPETAFEEINRRYADPPKIGPRGYTPEMLTQARKIATETIETYGDFDEPTMRRFREHGIWNDHTAVQAALRALGMEEFRPEPAIP